MSEVLDQLRQRVLGDIFYHIERIDRKTYDTLPDDEKAKYDVSSFDYVRKVPMDIPEEEEQRIINLKLLEFAKRSDRNIGIMKNIMVFWAVLTAIGLIISILTMAH